MAADMTYTETLPEGYTPLQPIPVFVVKRGKMFVVSDGAIGLDIEAEGETLEAALIGYGDTLAGQFNHLSEVACIHFPHLVRQRLKQYIKKE